MGRWTDIAEWRGPTVNEGDGDGRPNEPEDRLNIHRWVVVHIAEGTYEGTIAWQKNKTAQVSSHFVVAKDGRIAQMVDTNIRAWTQRGGNSSGLSIENEGYVRDGGLTAAQVAANARILAKAHQVHGVRLELASSPTGYGLGHHSMGAENGYDWGHSQCPGTKIKAQKPEILRQAQALIWGEDEEENDVMTPKQDGALTVAYQATDSLLDMEETTETGGEKPARPNKFVQRFNAMDARMNTMLASLQALAKSADIDATELAAIREAARQGALQGLATMNAQELAKQLLAILPPSLAEQTAGYVLDGLAERLGD